MTDWEKYLKRKSDNIGFISRLGAFRDPTPAEIARAIMIETESWQKSIGKKNYKVGKEYSTPIYKNINDYGITTKGHREEGDPHTFRNKAIKTYVDTPISIGKETWLVMDWWTAIKHWFKKNR